MTTGITRMSHGGPFCNQATTNSHSPLFIPENKFSGGLSPAARAKSNGTEKVGGGARPSTLAKTSCWLRLLSRKADIRVFFISLSRRDVRANRHPEKERQRKTVNTVQSAQVHLDEHINHQGANLTRLQLALGCDVPSPQLQMLGQNNWLKQAVIR